MKTDIADLDARAAAAGARVQGALRSERLERGQLSLLEREVEEAARGLEAWLEEARARYGPTPDVRLAEVGLTAARDGAAWANRFRKHAPLAERRERLGLAAQGVLGALAALRRCEEI